jgi:hypothetical protein
MNTAHRQASMLTTFDFQTAENLSNPENIKSPLVMITNTHTMFTRLCCSFSDMEIKKRRKVCSYLDCCKPRKLDDLYTKVALFVQQVLLFCCARFQLHMLHGCQRVLPGKKKEGNFS